MLGRKSLTDVVKGIRAHKTKEEPFIRGCLSEIAAEVKNTSIAVKAEAVNKGVYLDMKGYPLGWPFHVIEVLSRREFHYKRLGYLAASQSFTQNTQEIMLMTQTLRTDIGSSDPYIVGVALNALSNIMTPQLAHDLVSSVVSLLGSQRPYVRSKALLVLYKVFIAYPDALRPSFARIQQKLTDQHPSVTSAAVNVICELARKNPKNYLPLVPTLYNLLQSMRNNWTLIKIVKLFDTLIPYEARLPRKLKEPIMTLIRETRSKSLLYECLSLATRGMQKYRDVIRVAVDQLKTFVVDRDPNLKYLGLRGLSQLLSRYPKVISDLKDEILSCLDDRDISIRQRAVDLLCGVMNKRNCRGIVRKLLKHSKSQGDVEDRNYVIGKILESCSRENYDAVRNFKWYLETLLNFCWTSASSAGDLLQHGGEIGAQIMDILIRVRAVREWGVLAMVRLLESKKFRRAVSEQSAGVRDEKGAAAGSAHEVLYAALYCVGEFVGCLPNKLRVIEAMLNRELYRGLPSRILAAFVQALSKVYVAVMNLAPTGSGSFSAGPVVASAASSSSGTADILTFDDDDGSAAPTAAAAAAKKVDLMDILSLSGGGDEPPVSGQLSVGDSSPKKAPEEEEEEEEDGEDEDKDTPPSLGPRDDLAEGEVGAMKEMIRDGFLDLLKSPSCDLETSERIACFLTLMDLSEGAPLPIEDLFAGDLNPVREGSILRVPVPEGLDLEAWIGNEFEPNFEALDEFTFDGWDEGSSSGPRDDLPGLPGIRAPDLPPIPSMKGMMDAALFGPPEEYDSSRGLYILGKGPAPSSGGSEGAGGGRSGGSGKKHRHHGKHRHHKKGKGRGKHSRRGGRKKRHHRDEIEFDDGGETPVVSTEFEGVGLDDAPTKAAPAPTTSDPLAQVDLTKPVADGLDELPEIKAYPHQTTIQSIEEQRLQASERQRVQQTSSPPKKPSDLEQKPKSRRHRHRRHHRKGSSSSSSKSGSSSRSKGRRHRSHRGSHRGSSSSKKRSGSGEPKPAEATATDPRASILDFFGGDGDGGAPAPAVAAPPAAPSETSPSSSSSSSRRRRHHRHGRRGGRDHRDRGSSSEGSGSSRKKPTGPKLIPVKLCKNESLHAIYTTNVTAFDAFHYSFPVHLRNISTTHPISRIKYNVNDNNYVKLKRTYPGSGKVDLPFEVRPGDDRQFDLHLHVENYDIPRDLSGAFYYQLGPRKIRLRFYVSLPCSLFLEPKKISAEELALRIRNKEMPFPSSTRLTLNQAFPTVEKVARAVCERVHLAVCQVMQEGPAYNLYGSTVKGHLVAVQVKGRGGDPVGVDIKSSNDQFGQSLLKEIYQTVSRV